MSVSAERRSLAARLLRLGVVCLIIFMIYYVISSLASCFRNEIVGFRKEVYQSKYVPNSLPVTYYKGKMHVRFNQHMTSQPTVYLEEDEMLYMQAWTPGDQNVSWLFKIKGLYSENVMYCAITPKNTGQLQFFETDNSHHVWITAPCLPRGETADLAVWIADYEEYSRVPYSECRPEPWDICK